MSDAVKKSSRRRAREFALQGIYQWRLSGNDEAAIEAHLHEGEDFDSLGSAMGVARMAAHLGKTVNIVVGTVALSFEKLQQLLPDYAEYGSLFLTVELIKHQLQRSPIGRHLVGVAAHKVVAALAQLENLGGGCFGTLHQRLARHHVLRKHA